MVVLGQSVSEYLIEIWPLRIALIGVVVDIGKTLSVRVTTLKPPSDA
jgi:hypothetical protein